MTIRTLTSGFLAGALVAALPLLVSSPAHGETDLPLATLDERLVKLEGAQNFRDLGGYPTTDGRVTKWGLVYRSDTLDRLTDEDWIKVKDLGIKVVCDFRFDAERARWPSDWPDAESVEFIQRDYSFESAAEIMESYHKLAYQQAPTYIRMFDRLADPEAPPTLVHCMGGQDRTGFAAAFLLEALGVSRDVVVADYTLTQHLRGFSDIDPETLADILGFYGLEGDLEQMLDRQKAPDRREVAHKQFVDAFAAIEKDHGSVMAFIRKELQVDDAQLARLRERLLEEP